MISLETAKKLKEFGIEGHADHDSRNFELGLTRMTTTPLDPEWYVLPRLDQLLAEIEKRGYIWSVEVGATNGNAAIGYAVSIATGLHWRDEREFTANSPEEAAAQALIWIIEQEKTCPYCNGPAPCACD